MFSWILGRGGSGTGAVGAAAAGAVAASADAVIVTASEARFATASPSRFFRSCPTLSMDVKMDIFFGFDVQVIAQSRPTPMVFLPVSPGSRSLALSRSRESEPVSPACGMEFKAVLQHCKDRHDGDGRAGGRVRG